MRRLAIAAAVLLSLLVAVLVARSVGRDDTAELLPPAPLAFDPIAAAERFAGGLRFETISHGSESGESLDVESVRAFHRYLEGEYPRVHTSLQRETVAEHSLLYTWPGSDATLRPLVLMGHFDVVPVPEENLGRWEQPPFAGVIADGFIWGRGAIDDKFNVFGLLEACEALLAEGFQPTRSVILSFGHDEEIGGSAGATTAAALLAERGVVPHLVLDEGGGLTVGLFPGIDDPIAAIMVAEKGGANLALSVESPAGHSSTPPPHTSVGILASAVHRLERDPMASHFDGPFRALMAHAGRGASFPLSVVFANLWLFGPLVEQGLLQVPQAAAMVRTTTAVTMFNAGVKSNVLPSRAEAVVNFRLYPGDSVEDVVGHVQSAVDDERVAIEVRSAREASSVSPYDGEAFELLSRTIGQVFPGSLVGPTLSPGGTDSRHFRGISPNVYGFMPVVFEREDLKRMHGTNERVSVDGFADGVRFYAQLIRNAS